MKVNGKIDKKVSASNPGKSLSLHPLKVDEALKALLEIPPSKKSVRQKNLKSKASSKMPSS